MAVHKRRSQSGGGGCPVRTFCGQGSSSDADVCTWWCKKHWCKKHWIFRN